MLQTRSVQTQRRKRSGRLVLFDDVISINHTNNLPSLFRVNSFLSLFLGLSDFVFGKIIAALWSAEAIGDVTLQLLLLPSIWPVPQLAAALTPPPLATTATATPAAACGDDKGVRAVPIPCRMVADENCVGTASGVPDSVVALVRGRLN